LYLDLKESIKLSPTASSKIIALSGTPGLDFAEIM
jgi:hypothetical protein